MNGNKNYNELKLSHQELQKQFINKMDSYKNLSNIQLK